MAGEVDDASGVENQTDPTVAKDGTTGHAFDATEAGAECLRDDLALPKMTSTPHGYILRRRGSCESGFFSVGTCDWLLDSSALSSTRSIGSSLVSLELIEA